MEKVKELINKGIEKIKALNKQQKIIFTKVIIVVLVGVGLGIFEYFDHQAYLKVRQRELQEESSYTSSSSNDSKVTSESKAISYAKTKNLKWDIKEEGKFHSVSRIEVTDEKASKDSWGDYEVTLKGNASGYTDDYDTKLKRVTFTAKLKVYKNGGVSITSVSLSSY